jgi:tetratricopeptide (TPR) repeat protein
MVTDSNDDWGQGLKWTKTYMDQHPANECWFDYNNPLVDPAYYGIPCKPLPSGMALMIGKGTANVPTTISGTVLISATDATGIHWGPGSLNPYQAILDRRPDAEIDNVVLVYHGSFDISQLAGQNDAANAFTLLRQHRIPEALAAAQTAVQLAPDNARVNATLGRVLSAAGRVQEARQANAKALQLAEAVHPEFQQSLIQSLKTQLNSGGAAH